MKIDRACVAYVFNKDNKVLLLKHKKLGVWLPPGGHVEENETISDAAVRETFEETGVTFEFMNLGMLFGRLDARAIVCPQPFLVQLEDLGDHFHEDFIYLGRAISEEIINKENHEIGWFSFNEAKALELFENTRKHLFELEAFINEER